MHSANIVSKARVAKFGEVYTPDNIVKDMLDIVKKESYRLEATFLEPSCGNGNFLVVILTRKLHTAGKLGTSNYDRNIFIAVSSIYGIDIIEDNIEKSKKRMTELIEICYKNTVGSEISEEMMGVIDHVLKANIIWGNSLTGYREDIKGLKIAIAEWKLDEDIVQRKDYEFNSLSTRINDCNYEPITFKELYNLRTIVAA